MVTSMMATNMCSGSGSGSGGIVMSKSEISEMGLSQLGSPSNRRISGSYRGSNSIPPLGPRPYEAVLPLSQGSPFRPSNARSEIKLPERRHLTRKRGRIKEGEKHSVNQ
jgi:hypothetical protein